MLFGISTFIAYAIFMSKFDSLTIGEAKNFVIFIPILFILAIVELFAEIKYGLKKSMECTGKIIKASAKKTVDITKKSKYKRIQKKIDTGQDISEKDIAWMQKYRNKIKEKSNDS